MRKIIAILLCMTIILGSFNHQISAKDYRKDDFTLYENYEQYADEMSKIENYVTIENGKYALKLTKEAEKLFSRDSINYAQNHISALNYVIKRNSVSDVSVDQGFIVKISDKKLAEAYKSVGVNGSNIEGNNYVSLKGKPVNSINTIYTINSDNIITSGGITKVVFKWDGIEIWLSSTATRLICIGGAGAVIALFGLALGSAAIGVAIAGGVGAIAGDLVSGVSFPPMVYKYRGALSDQVACQTENGGHTPFINLP